MMALLLAMALVLIALSAGLPAISAELRRRREEELIHRGVQYTRAIRKYYRRFGSYPPGLEQLEDSNHLHFLRKRYTDPMTGSDFRLLHVGEVQLSFNPSGSAAESAVNGLNDSATKGGESAPSPSPLVPLPTMRAMGPTFGGGPIMGVASTSDKQSFHVFNDKDHYNDWQFVYSPVLEGAGLPTHPFNGARDLATRSLPGIPQLGTPQIQSSPDLNTPGTVRPPQGAALVPGHD